MKGSWEKWSKETYLHEEKGWEKKRKKWHNGKKENQTNRWEEHLKRRREADMQTCCQLHLREADPQPPPPPPAGPEPSQGPRERVRFKKTHDQNLKTNSELNPSFRIITHTWCFKFSPQNHHVYGLMEKTLETEDLTHPHLQMREERMKFSPVSMVTIMSLRVMRSFYTL